MTIVLITHDLAVARYFAQGGRIGVMYLGRVVELADSELVVGDPAHPYTAALVAAIPEADPDAHALEGARRAASAEVPSLLRLPPGCTFHPRCPLFEEGLCDVQEPELLPMPGRAGRLPRRGPRARTGGGAFGRALGGPRSPARQSRARALHPAAGAPDTSLPGSESGAFVVTVLAAVVALLFIGAVAARRALVDTACSEAGGRQKKMTNGERTRLQRSQSGPIGECLSPGKERVDEQRQASLHGKPTSLPP